MPYSPQLIYHMSQHPLSIVCTSPMPSLHCSYPLDFTTLHAHRTHFSLSPDTCVEFACHTAGDHAYASVDSPAGGPARAAVLRQH